MKNLIFVDCEAYTSTMNLNEHISKSLEEFRSKFRANSKPRKDVVFDTTKMENFLRDSQIKLLKKVVEEAEKMKKPITSRFASMPKEYNQALSSLQEIIKSEIEKIQC